MPSRFEPCGLNQMYSQRYGTLPLVHATGGLVDTVENFDESTGAGTGFAFYSYDAPSLLATLRWALSVYQNGDTWARLQVRAMRKDYSWQRAARANADTYAQAAALRQASRVLTV
jgi:starch synthase